MLSTIVGVIGIGTAAAFVALIVALAISKPFSDKFHRAMRITTNKAHDEVTPLLDEEKDIYQQLLNKLSEQERAVANVMANATLEKKALVDKQAAVIEIQNEFVSAKELGVSEKELSEIVTSFEKAQEAVITQQAIVDKAVSDSNVVREALDTTVKDLEKFAKRIKADENNVEMTKAMNTATAARQTMQDISNGVSSVSQASDEIALQVEIARAAHELAGGTETKFDELKKNEAVRPGRAALEAIYSGSTEQK